MYKSSIFLILLSFCVLFSAAHASEQALFESLNRLSRSLQSAQRGHNIDEAEARRIFAMESGSTHALRNLIASAETEQELIDLSESLRRYAEDSRTSGQQMAFEYALERLNHRARYIQLTTAVQMPHFARNVKQLKDRFGSVASRQQEHAIVLSTLERSSEVPDELLGAHVKDGKTSFSVYSSAATSVKLAIFANADDEDGQLYDMVKDEYGVWRYTLDGELYGTYYGFYADGPRTGGHLFDPDRLLSDPYAFANVNFDGKSIVVDRSFNWTDHDFVMPPHEDLIVYEMHIKDFTAHESSGVDAPYRDNYLGLLQGRGTDKVIGHLKDLGVNALELLPVHEFDNNFAGVTNHWGYMTTHFFAPETTYATGDSGQAVTEFKKLVNGLHNEGFAVIMDVVYNHTAEGDHRGMPLNFKGLDNPGYYRLMDNYKYYWNGSGCGNEFRSESPMGRKVILDSLKYWVEDYHIDGFRFDLGTLIDKKTMQLIIDELPEHIFLTAEPWAADWNRNLWGKSDFQGTRLSKWNDDFRETIRAFASGSANRNDVQTMMAGTCFWWTSSPIESLNYVECHDGYTLNDLFHGDKKKTRFAAVALLTAQGIPMIHSGQEFNRSKQGNHNSYDQDNEINWIDWNAKEQNRDIYELYRGLIELRLRYPNFRSRTALTSDKVDWLLPPNQNGLGMLLKGDTNILLLFNGDSRAWVTFDLPYGGKWDVLCDGERVDVNGLFTAEGNYAVPPTTAVILRF